MLVKRVNLGTCRNRFVLMYYQTNWILTHWSLSLSEKNGDTYNFIITKNIDIFKTSILYAQALVLPSCFPLKLEAKVLQTFFSNLFELKLYLHSFWKVFKEKCKLIWAQSFGTNSYCAGDFKTTCICVLKTSLKLPSV